MIDWVTIASNRGHPSNCRNCEKKIKLLTVRGLQKSKPFNNYFCEKCLKEQLDSGIKKIKEMKKEYERLSKMNKQEKMGYLNRLKILKKL